MSTWLTSGKEFLTLNIKVIPNSSKNQISILGEQLKINITAPAIDNRANQTLVKFLAKSLQIKKSSLSIISGEKAKTKQVALFGYSKKEIITKINEVIHD